MPTPAASSASASAAHRAADRAGRLPGALAGLSGWRRSSTALALGALLAAALPPFHLLAAAVIAFTFWAWLLDGAQQARRAFLDGWCFGAGFSAAAFYWIANALLVDAARFGWLYPVALAAIAAGFGLFPAAAALAAQRAPAGAPRTLALAIAWLVAEWLRSWLFTGFPWNLAGTAFAFSDALIQPAAWGGPWLLTALLLAAALAPALAQRAGRLRPAAALKGLLASVAIVAAAWAAGTARLAAHPVAQDAGGTVLRLVQPAIAQRQKGDPALEEAHFAAHAALTLARPPAPAPTVVIWPEAAVPWGLMRDQATPARLAALAPPQGALLAGAVTVGRGEDGRRWARNSLLAVAGDGAIAFYHKHRLVPFGEYVPLRGLLPIDRIVPGIADFAPGPGPATMAPAGLPPFAPLICYEAIFADAVPDGPPRPAWLANITNDGWFGRSSGPWQHFQAARLRAVERGLPMVRAANSGISAVIDPLGRVLARLPLGHRGVLDAPLPAPLETAPPYAAIGEKALFAILLPAFAALAWSLRPRRRLCDLAPRARPRAAKESRSPAPGGEPRA